MQRYFNSKCKGDPYDIPISTLTPATCFSDVRRAHVETASTNVAVIPPWSVPPLFWSSSETVISQTQCPFPPLTTLIYKSFFLNAIIQL